MKHSNTDLPAGLAQPALRALAGAGIQNLEQLTKFSEAELKKLHGLGPHDIEKLRAALNEQGWSFAEAGSHDRH